MNARVLALAIVTAIVIGAGAWALTQLDTPANRVPHGNPAISVVSVDQPPAVEISEGDLVGPLEPLRQALDEANASGEGAVGVSVEQRNAIHRYLVEKSGTEQIETVTWGFRGKSYHISYIV